MKKVGVLILSFAFLCGIVLLIGCSRKTKDSNEVLNVLKDLETYTADITVTVKNQKQVLNYMGRQAYSGSLGCRLELGEDRVFIFKEEKIQVYDLKNGGEYTTPKDFDSLYKLTFIGEYIKLLYTNEKIPIIDKEIEGKMYTLIELLIPGTNRNLDKAVLYVEKKSKLPSQLIIYDTKKNERVQVEYKNFTWNSEIKEEWFKGK